MQPRASSLARYSATTVGCSLADLMLVGADFRWTLPEKPIRKLKRRPVHIYLAKALSGCDDRAWAHVSTSSGVDTALRKGEMGGGASSAEIEAESVRCVRI